MRNITKSMLFGVIAVLMSGSVIAAKGGVDKINICHFDKDFGVFEPITVGTPSVQKHMEKHGDRLNPFVTQNDDPIWSNDQAQSGECAARCDAEGGTFTGSWWTTVPGQHSVCACSCSG